MRTFIALELSPEIKQSLGRMMGTLSSLTRNVRWARPEGMHVTLKFLGEISEAQADRVSAALKLVAHRHGRVSCAARGTGWFPEKSRSPRVLWVGLEAGPELGALHQDLDQELGKEGFPREDRAFHPHLTLGRVKSPHGLQPLLRELELNSTAEFGSVTSSKITFFQSRLRPEGAEYSILGSYPFT